MRVAVTYELEAGPNHKFQPIAAIVAARDSTAVSLKGTVAVSPTKLKSSAGWLSLRQPKYLRITAFQKLGKWKAVSLFLEVIPKDIENKEPIIVSNSLVIDTLIKKKFLNCHENKGKLLYL